MQSAAHVEALKCVFQGEGDPIARGVVQSSILTITSKIFFDYRSELERLDSYRVWFAAAQGQNRIKLEGRRPPNKISSLNGAVCEYATAAYFAGGNLFVNSKSNDAIMVQKSNLQNLGLSFFDVNAPVATMAGGDKLIDCISLNEGGSLNFDLINKYIISEDEIVIYDKYIDEEGLDFLKHVRRIIPENSILKIFTSNLGARGGCFLPPDIETALASSSPAVARDKTNCSLVTPAFRRKAHDRYMFVGRRLHLVFSAGIKCFGPLKNNGDRSNIYSEISVYIANPKNPIDIDSGRGNTHRVYMR